MVIVEFTYIQYIRLDINSVEIYVGVFSPRPQIKKDHCKSINYSGLFVGSDVLPFPNNSQAKASELAEGTYGNVLKTFELSN